MLGRQKKIESKILIYAVMGSTWLAFCSGISDCSRYALADGLMVFRRAGSSDAAGPIDRAGIPAGQVDAGLMLLALAVVGAANLQGGS